MNAASTKPNKRERAAVRRVQKELAECGRQDFLLEAFDIDRPRESALKAMNIAAAYNPGSKDWVCMTDLAAAFQSLADVRNSAQRARESQRRS